MDNLRIGLLVCFVAIVVALGTEAVCRNFATPSIVSRRQFGMRVLTASLFLLLIAMVFAGTYWVVDAIPLVQLLYWTLCIVLALLIMVMAILDVRAVMIHYLVERQNLYRGSPQDSLDKGKDNG